MLPSAYYHPALASVKEKLLKNRLSAARRQYAWLERPDFWPGLSNMSRLSARNGRLQLLKPL